MRFYSGERSAYPPCPDHYFNSDVRVIANHHKKAVQAAKEHGHALPAFPTAHIEPLLDNIWRDTAKAIVNNWLGIVYEHTDFNGPRPHNNDFATTHTEEK